MCSTNCPQSPVTCQELCWGLRTYSDTIYRVLLFHSECQFSWQKAPSNWVFWGEHKTRGGCQRKLETAWHLGNKDVAGRQAEHQQSALWMRSPQWCVVWGWVLVEGCRLNFNFKVWLEFPLLERREAFNPSSRSWCVEGPALQDKVSSRLAVGLLPQSGNGRTRVSTQGHLLRGLKGTVEEQVGSGHADFQD